MKTTESPPTVLRSLLVVEDNRDVADSLAFILRNNGYNVSIAYDGDQAVRMVEDSEYDVILCDIGLPGRSGYDVAAYIRRVRGSAPFVVAVSAFSTDNVKENASRAGFNRFFSKPADPIELERVLREHASKKTDVLAVPK